MPISVLDFSFNSYEELFVESKRKLPKCNFERLYKIYLNLIKESDIIIIPKFSHFNDHENVKPGDVVRFKILDKGNMIIPLLFRQFQPLHENETFKDFHTGIFLKPPKKFIEKILNYETPDGIIQTFNTDNFFIDYKIPKTPNKIKLGFSKLKEFDKEELNDTLGENKELLKQLSESVINDVDSSLIENKNHSFKTLYILPFDSSVSDFSVIKFNFPDDLKELKKFLLYRGLMCGKILCL